jgi:serine/threonine protein phosphatase 1
VGEIGLFKSWFSKAPKAQLSFIESVEFASVDDDTVVYAIGDIHGMAGLLDDLLHKIIDDMSMLGRKAVIIFLGDMIDRGPESKRTLEVVHQLIESNSQALSVHALLGNHEKMLFEFIDKPEKAGSQWLRHGGDATLKSFGVHPPQQEPNAKHLRYLRDELVGRLPPEHLHWLKTLPKQFTIGDYFFCHASINARKTLQQQSDEDLLWSRRFPGDGDGPMEKILVHGHLPVQEPLIAKYHINVDTGAYATGCLTAVKLINNQRRFLSVGKQEKLQKGQLQ